MKIDSIFITELEQDIVSENKLLKEIIHKEGPNIDMSKYPHFFNAEYVVPQVCKRQLLIYLKSINNGLSHKEALISVLVSRFDENPNARKDIKAIDFEYLVNNKKTTLANLCKEILIKEENVEDIKLKDYICDSVDNYFNLLPTKIRDIKNIK